MSNGRIRGVDNQPDNSRSQSGMWSVEDHFDAVNDGAWYKVASVSFEYTDGGGNATPSDPETYSSMSIGTAQSNRWIYCFIGQEDTGQNNITSVTIGGVTATELAEVQQVSTAYDEGTLWLFRANVPTGTTADVVIDWAGTPDNSAIALYAVYDDVNTNYQIDTSDDVDNPSFTIDRTAGAPMIFCYVSGNSNNWVSFSDIWTVGSPDFEYTTNADMDFKCWSATDAQQSKSPLLAQTITTDSGGSNNACIMLGLRNSG